MALSLGTNCGFVTSAPSADPAGTNIAMDNKARVTKDTSPGTAARITEVGWWCDNGSEESNYEVGLYDTDGTAGAPGTLLYSSRVNAKGTGSGWKRAVVDWDINPSHAYFIAVQLDDTATTTNTNYGSTSGGAVNDDGPPMTALTDPWAGVGPTSNFSYAFYALWDTGATGTNFQVNIGDSWKSVAGLQINIGDSWKDVAGVQVNIGDSWKTVF